MTIYSKYFFARAGHLILVFGLQLSLGCARPDLFVGLSGKYNEGKFELLRRVGGNTDKAIDNFESIAKQDPTYRDSLALLGRAYYKKGRYQDAYAVLQRAVAIRNDDDLAWLTYGATQLRLGDDQRGLESVQGGLTLFSKATADHNYRSYTGWDPADRVKTATRRAVFVALKGLEQKDDLIKSVETILTAVADEEFHQLFEKRLQQQQYE
jgi:tetratricopeptide (TPR) repeat protein